jgi:hypothetical protein
MSSMKSFGYSFEPVPKKRQKETRQSVTGQSGDPTEINVPMANLGVPIPYLVGRQRVTKPNTMWLGNIRPIVSVEREVHTDTETVDNVETTVETVTTTYKTVGYNASVQFSICLGPGVVLRAIGVGDDTLWEGTAGPDRETINIPSLLNVITGDCIFSGGNFDQAPDTFLEDFIDPAQLPGYIGVAYIIVKDVNISQLSGSYPWFEVERYPNPLGLSSGDNQIGSDLNLASAMADYVGTDWGGAGAGTAAIGTSFATAAATLADELNAVSFQLSEESSAADIIRLLSQQADGLIYEDPDTGLVEFKLFRRSLVDPVTVLRLTPQNSSRIGRWERDAWPSTKNKLRVTYTNRAKDYEVDNILGYTFNAINDRFKANRSGAVDFPLCCTTALAKTLLARELGKAGVPLAVGEIEVTRVGANETLPGDPVQVLMSDRIAPMTGFVMRVRRFSLSENRIILTFLEFPGQDSNVVFDAETTLGESLSVGPVEPTTVTIKQAPIWMARKQGASILNDPTSIRALILPTPDSDLQASFNAYISNRPGATSYLVEINRYAPYPTVGTLQTAIGQFDDMDDGVLASVTLENVVNSTFLRSEGATGVTEGRVFMFIDNEILSFETAAENVDGSWTVSNVHRALLDTAPQAHAADAPVFVLGNNYGTVSDAFTYPVAYTPAFRITSNTAFAEGDPNTDYLPSTTWDKSFSRQALPPRPHNTKIDGADRSDSLANIFGDEGVVMSPSDAITVTWNTRSRADLPVKLQTDAASAAEINPDGTYQLHRVMIRDSGGTLRDCGATADDATYNTLAATVHASTAQGNGVLFVRAEADNGNSYYEDQIPVTVFATDYYVDETAAEFFTSEDGAFFFIMN